MNLAQITAYIGESYNFEGETAFSSITKNVPKVKEDETPYIVAMVFDLQKDVIYFELLNQVTEDASYKYNYFGNNIRASLQYYLTREVKSMNYLLTSTFTNLYRMLEKYNLHWGDLGQVIIELEKKGFITLENNKVKGTVSLEKLSFIQNHGLRKIDIEPKEISIDGVKYNNENFLRLFIGDNNKKNRFQLIIPVVRYEDKSDLILSNLPDYLQLVKLDNKLGLDTDEIGAVKVEDKRTCYICKQNKSGVTSEYTTKFLGSRINKIFTITTKNTAPYLQNFDYDNAYSICKECYQKLRKGEKVIAEKFAGKIAGEDVFIIPEGLLDDFNYNFLYDLKNNVDIAFSSKDVREILASLEGSSVFDNVDLYSLNFIIYRTDGNSLSVLQTIEDVPLLRLQKVLSLFNDFKSRIESHLNCISLGSVYSMIPVRISKKREQIDIGRVLSLYKALLSGEQVDKNILFQYSCEALDKGLKQMSKGKVDNFQNLFPIKFKSDDGYIKRIVMQYLVLMGVCQEIKILNKNIFKYSGEEECKMKQLNTSSDKVNNRITDMDNFLQDQGFNNDARALFYLGALVYQVALAQLQKKHKNKPILQKIQFQGMKVREVINLYQDVIEKLRQYDKLTLFNEALMNKFHQYYGSLDRSWSLNEHANVFYIMAGYSYLVDREVQIANNTVEDQNLEISIDEDQEGNQL